MRISGRFGMFWGCVQGAVRGSQSSREGGGSTHAWSVSASLLTKRGKWGAVLVGAEEFRNPCLNVHFGENGVINLSFISKESIKCCDNQQKYDHDETRTRNLLIRSQTPYPLGHAATCMS